MRSSWHVGVAALVLCAAGCMKMESRYRPADERRVLVSSPFFSGEVAPVFGALSEGGETGYIPPSEEGSKNTDGGTVGGGNPPPGGTDGGGIDVELPRVCTWHWEPIFFEDAVHPIFTVEGEPNPQDNWWCPPELGALCGVVQGSLGKPAAGSVVLTKVDLRGFDMASAKFRARMALNFQPLKAHHPMDWQRQNLRARVCDDREGTGSCRGKGVGRIINVANVDFPAGRVPESLRVDVFSVRVGYNSAYYRTLPEFCEGLVSPLVLDLNGDGIVLSSPRSGVRFDLEDNGHAVRTGWTWGRDDVFLARDLDGNGKIDSGAELFGSATRLADGSRAPNGFEALKELDSDGDGRITPADRDWDRLLLWADVNHNGISEAEELHPLYRADLESIHLGYVEVSEVDPFGNQTRQRSTYRRLTGGMSQPALILDVWFRTLSSY